MTINLRGSVGRESDRINGKPRIISQFTHTIPKVLDQLCPSPFASPIEGVRIHRRNGIHPPVVPLRGQPLAIDSPICDIHEVHTLGIANASGCNTNRIATQTDIGNLNSILVSEFGLFGKDKPSRSMRFGEEFVESLAFEEKFTVTGT
jgi:hypothetical protein